MLLHLILLDNNLIWLQKMLDQKLKVQEEPFVCYYQDARLCRLTCVPFEDFLAMIGLVHEFHAIISITLPLQARNVVGKFG